MKPHLLDRDEDRLAWRAVLAAAEARDGVRAGRHARPAPANLALPRPWNASDLIKDLRLDVLFDGMAGDDALVREVTEAVMLSAAGNNAEAVRYRQAVFKDCLAQPAVVRELYALATDAARRGQEPYIGSLLTRYPDWSVRNSSEVLKVLIEPIARLHKIAEFRSNGFESEGWTRLFAAIRKNLDSERLTRISANLEALRFRDGMLISACLGRGNKGADFRLHLAPKPPGGRLTRILKTRLPWLFGPSRTAAFDFELDPHDESGARSLAQIRNRGLAVAATAVGQAADHVRDFFALLRCELAFYIGCLNLHELLVAHGTDLCLPTPRDHAPHRLHVKNLRDVSLLLEGVRPVVGNSIDAEAKEAVIVTGANQGGKTTFLRSLGLAHLMMQAGLFVAAQAFEANVIEGLFTHFRREEDARLESGKLDEELARMSAVVDHLSRESLILCNESFAATNEREGSAIAGQLVAALLERRTRLVFVTHLFEFARALLEENREDVVFLRAERNDDGTRTFRLVAGAPLETGFAADLYARIFGDDSSGPPETDRVAPA